MPAHCHCNEIIRGGSSRDLNFGAPFQRVLLNLECDNVHLKLKLEYVPQFKMRLYLSSHSQFVYPDVKCECLEGLPP